MGIYLNLFKTRNELISVNLFKLFQLKGVLGEILRVSKDQPISHTLIEKIKAAENWNNRP